MLAACNVYICGTLLCVLVDDLIDNMYEILELFMHEHLRDGSPDNRSNYSKWPKTLFPGLKSLKHVDSPSSA